MGFLDKKADAILDECEDPRELVTNGIVCRDENDFKDAARFFEKAAKLGDAEAQYRIGSMYDIGEGVPPNRDVAIDWYIKSAGQGNAEAAFALGMMYMFGKGDEKDPELSLDWLNRAYDLGEKNTAYFIGEAYLLGNGTDRDVDKGIRFLKEASDIVYEFTDFPEDNYRAPLLLAETYDDGEVLERDEETAVKWYKVAAERGSQEASDRLKELKKHRL